MFRVKKVLNHNTVIGIGMEDHQEYLLMGKGIGFGRKVSERIKLPEGGTMYSLKEETQRGSAAELVKSIDPVCLEIAEQILKERLDVEIDAHEIGYIALHIHSAIEDENVALSMQIARTVRECIQLVEKETGMTIDVMSLSYNRLMNHVRYMAARAMSGEKLKLNMNDYMFCKFPDAYRLASVVCSHLENYLKKPLDEVEVGYLAMHIQRVSEE